MVTTAIILAGGLGTRLRSEVPYLPKPMASICDRPFLEYQMDFWINQGINKFILSVGYRRESIIDHFGEEYRGMPLEYSIETTPLGTGGGIIKSSGKMTEVFLVVNGDTFMEVDLDRFEHFHNDKMSDITLAVLKVDNSDRYTCLDISDNGKITSFGNNFQQSTAGFINGGVYLMSPSVLKSIINEENATISLEEYIMPTLILLGKSLYGMECDGLFIDIGIPKDYIKAKKIIPDVYHKWKGLK